MQQNQVKVRRKVDRWDGLLPSDRWYETESFWAEVRTPSGRLFMVVLQVQSDRGDSVSIYRYAGQTWGPDSAEVPEVTWFDDLDRDDVFASDLFVQLTGLVPALWREAGVPTDFTDFRAANVGPRTVTYGPGAWGCCP